MSFLENPFAEDEEPVEEPIVSGSPFGNYDATQRENEYNAMFVLSTTLEERLQRLEEQSAAKGAEHTRRTAQLRAELAAATEAPPRATTHAPLSSSPTAADELAANERRLLKETLRAQRNEAALAALADLERQLAGGRAKATTLTRAVRLFRSRILAQADARSSAMNDTEERREEEESNTDVVARPRFDTGPLESCVQQLIALQNASGENAGDTDFVAALLAHTAGALRRHQQYAAEAAELHRETTHRIRALHRMQAVANVLSAFLAEGSACDSPPTAKARRVEAGAPQPTFEERECGLANADLTREIARLEATVAAWLRQHAAEAQAEASSNLSEVDPSALASLSPVTEEDAGAAAVALALWRREELVTEAKQLGREVLFLRDVALKPSADTLASEQSARVLALIASVGCAGSEGGGESGHLAGDAGADALQRAVGARAAVMEGFLTTLEGALGLDIEGAPARDAAASLEAAVLQTRIAFAESYLPMQDACLAALTSIHEQLQKQAYGAALLTQLAVHDTECDAAVLRHLSEVPAPQLPPSLPECDGGNVPPAMREVAEWYLRTSSAPSSASPERVEAELTEKLSSSLSAAGEASARRQRLWKRVAEVLTQMLAVPEKGLAVLSEGGSQTDRANAGGRALTLRVEVKIDDAVEQAVAEATQATGTLIDEISRSLEQRRAELEKKLSWFGKQPHAAPLKTLRSLEKECSDLSARLHNFESIVKEAESSHAPLPLLREQLASRKSTLGTLEAEAGGLALQIQQMQQAIRELTP